jgi:hypothetical protein
MDPSNSNHVGRPSPTPEVEACVGRSVAMALPIRLRSLGGTATTAIDPLGGGRR